MPTATWLLAQPNENVVRMVAAHTGTYYGVQVAAGRVYTIEILVLADSTGIYYGQSMKAGHVYVLAGTGLPGFGGDGGPASKAVMTTPTAVRVLPDGNVLVSDDGRIRMISGA
jgi:hypothetical protein